MGDEYDEGENFFGEEVPVEEGGDWNADEVFGANYPDEFLDDDKGVNDDGDLAFQDFEHKESAFSAPPASRDAETLEAGGGDFASPVADDDDDDLPPVEIGAHWWQLTHWSYLFNVDHFDVLKRMSKSFTPFFGTFWETIEDNADLYGPFWITTTLIFFMAASGNFGYFIDSAQNSDSNEGFAHFEKTGTGAAMLYSYTFLLPLAVWGVFKWFTVGARLKDLWCLYGYSVTPYIPVTIICVAPYSLAKWIAIGAGCTLQTAMILGGIFAMLKENHMALAWPTMLTLAAVNVGMAIALRLYFWDYSNWE